MSSVTLGVLTKKLGNKDQLQPESKSKAQIKCNDLIKGNLINSATVNNTTPC